jgi:hypothetical protein
MAIQSSNLQKGAKKNPADFRLLGEEKRGHRAILAPGYPGTIFAVCELNF